MNEFTRLSRKFYALVLLIIYCSYVSAAPVGLEEILQEAVSYHPDILSKRGDARSAEYSLDAAQWGRFPSASIQAQSANSSNTVSRSTMGLLKIEQPLWTGGRLSSQIDSASANVKAASAAVVESEQNVLMQASVAFFEVLRLQSRLKSALTNEAEHTNLTSTMRRRVQSDINPVADFIQVSSRTKQAISDRIEIERALSTAQSALQQWVGRRINEIIDPAGISISFKSQQDFILAALEFSPERQRLIAEVEASDAKIGLAKAQFMPTLVAGYQARLDSPLPGEERDRFYFNFQMQSGAGLSSLSALNAAESHKTAAQNAVYAYDRQFTQELESLWQQQKALQDQLKPKKVAAKGQEDVVASYIRQFQVGKKTWIELLNSQQELAQTRYALADIEYSLQLTTIKLMLLAGQITAKNTLLKNDE